jgi:flagellar protein FliJ
MIKKYQFRLDPVLKVRKLKEENCRMELGQLITELNQIEDQLRYDETEIDNYFKLQENILQNGVKAGQLQAFPMLISGKGRNIELLNKALERQKKLIEEKKQELAILKGELKVIENLKEKDFAEYRKALNKEIDNRVEEQTQIWLEHNKKV